MTLGTVQYYAPEQAQGEIVSPAADVYALGIVMYEMVTGHPPFDGDSPVAVAMQHIQDVPTPPSHLNPNLPPALEEIILRCLEKVPEMRFRDGSQLARALESLADSELSEIVAAPLTSGHSPVPITYNQIPPRPNTSGRNPARDGQKRNPASSPDALLNGNDSSSRNGAGGVLGTDDERTVPLNQQRYNPPMYMPESGTPRPGQVGTVPRSGAVPRNKRGSRFASIITVLILLATLVFVGLSIYVFYSVFNNGRGVVQTPVVTLVYVPDLKTKTWTEAQTLASNAGFQLRSKDDTYDGIVVSQSPLYGTKASSGSTIEVLMKVQMVKIPAITKTTTLGPYEALLLSLGFHNYIVKSDGQPPTLPPDTVTKVSPSPGNPVPVDSQITIYVNNL